MVKNRVNILAILWKCIFLVSDTKYYVQLKLMGGNIQLLAVHGQNVAETVTLKKNWLWGILEINGVNAKLKLADKDIHLPTSITIESKDKIRIQRINKRGSLHFYIMVKQGISWFSVHFTPLRMQKNKT